MEFLEKHPMIMIVVGVMGVSLSAILVRYSPAPSVITAAYRLWWTVLLMTPVVFLSTNYRSELCRVKPRTALLCVASGFFLSLHFVLWFESLTYTSVASSTTIVSTEVIWVALGYCLFLGGKISPRQAAAIAAAILGSAIIAFSDSTEGAGHLTGDILALLAVLAEAVYTLIGGIVRKTTSTTVYTYLVYCASSVTLFLAALLSRTPLTGYGSQTLVVTLMLAVFCTILGHSIFSWCLRFFTPAFVSIAKLCEPVVASIIAVFLFREVPGPGQILGAVILLSGVIAYARTENGT